jgi:hypothetical protein
MAHISLPKRGPSHGRRSQLCARLCEALEAAGKNRDGNHWRESALVIVPKDLRLTLARKLLGEHLDPPEFGSGGVLNFGNATELLAAIGASTAQTANPLFWRISMMVSYTGRLDPQIVYFQHVLWLWTDIFGGNLRFSRNPDSGKLGGPLIRYFFSVTRPLMRSEAPAIESVPDIVRRQRAFSRWLDSLSSVARSRAISTTTL